MLYWPVVQLLIARFSWGGLVDELIVNVEPAVLGHGIPLFASGDFEKRLERVAIQELPEGIVQLRYRVKK